jgi:hypothetical protein
VSQDGIVTSRRARDPFGGSVAKGMKKIRYNGMDNRCVLRIGPDIMFFTGYQPQNSRDEFCDNILNTGQTVVALDMQDTELRNMLAEIRIIRDDGTHTRVNGLPVLTDAELASKEVLDPVTINYLPPKKYPTSTLTLTYLPREREIHRCRDGAKRTGRCCGRCSVLRVDIRRRRG